MTQTELSGYTAACRKLVHETHTLLLSTLSAQSFPEISYAPFVQDARGCLYIYVSELADHCRSLQLNPECSVLLIRDESASSNLFARERLMFKCEVSQVAPAFENYLSVLDQLEQRQGQTVQLLRSLPDFHLFALKPVSGRYIVGFGKAFEVNPLDFSLEHIDADRLKRV
ncbi:MAG: HugZ family protein [Pontibacterium sp.]